MPTDPRARDLLDLPGETGPANAITDVPGVTVGVETLVRGTDVRTGVTAILPRGRDGVGEPCAAGWYSLNGNGELTGTTWIEESGALTMPVTLSNTHAVGACHTGVVAWVNEVHPRLAAQWLLPVCGETWDGYLNDINGDHVRPEHARAALDAATSGPVPEGSVGGGTGMNCYAFKGGTGTSSRRVRFGGTSYTVGVLVQANFGSREELVVRGTPLGRTLREDNPMEDTTWFERDLVPAGAGSVIVVVATDAPLLPHQCKALARRVPLGLARTGTAGGHFSGDIFLAFSTAPAPGLRSQLAPVPTELADQQLVPWGAIDPFYTAVVEAVEESVLNALVVNREMVGRDGHRSPALPHSALRAVPAARNPRN
ncbi:P1 family peptidase [Nocardioides sp. R1-1]|uniref:DmpA family aminopeptidase n=1 Tax=Nocardioides sp. R1-1 TaxID=3383502 RepID=UPI0038D2456E